MNWSNDDKLKYVEEVLKPLCSMSHLSRTLDHIVESFGLAVEQKHNVATAGASANGTVDGVHPANVQHKTQGGAIHLLYHDMSWVANVYFI